MFQIVQSLLAALASCSPFYFGYSPYHQLAPTLPYTFTHPANLTGLVVARPPPYTGPAFSPFYFPHQPLPLALPPPLTTPSQSGGDGAYTHDPSGDTALPYIHDTRGDEALPYQHDDTGDE